MITITKPEGSALGYCVCYPKVHVMCLLLVVNSRVDLKKDIVSSSNVVSSQSLRAVSILGKHRC